MPRPRRTEEWLDAPSSFAPLESPYTGVMKALDALDANLERIGKYSAALRLDAEELDRQWKLARVAEATGPTEPAAGSAPKGKAWKTR